MGYRNECTSLQLCLGLLTPSFPSLVPRESGLKGQEQDYVCAHAELSCLCGVRIAQAVEVGAMLEVEALRWCVSRCPLKPL